MRWTECESDILTQNLDCHSQLSASLTNSLVYMHKIIYSNCLQSSPLSKYPYQYNMYCLVNNCFTGGR